MVLRAASVVAVWLLLSPAAAFAGAPNYDCAAGANGRLSIDQWAGVAAAHGFAPGPTLWGAASQVSQDGGSLDLVAVLGGASWKVAIRGAGSSLTIDTPSGTISGTCTFVPGNFVLRPADSAGHVLRAGPSPSARRLLEIPRGTGVWQIPDTEKSGGWLKVVAFVARAGAATGAALASRRGHRYPDGTGTIGLPIEAFGSGLYDMIGNAWQWVEDCYEPRAAVDGRHRLMT